jgi:signal transduction histidine kinase
MHLVVQAHVDESENAIATMGQVEIALWGITMVILMLEALFIFRPMMSTIVDQVKVLDKKKTDAEKNLEHLKATRQALVESQRIVSLGRMVSGFSHELSTPLGIAVSATSQIEESIADLKDRLLTLPEGNNKNIDNNVTHITETALIASINLSRAGRLLDMFKQSSIDKYSEENHEFNLSKLTQDTAQNLNHELKAKSVQVLVNCSDDITLEGKPSLLEQLITNLIVNSLTHGYPDGSVLQQTPTITINWRVDPIKETISLEYHDNGLGIDAAIADRLFEPFATNRPAQGRGLGLYICHTIVTQELKGTLRSDLTAGAGATFHAEFPLTA